jgi:hypothetical protein
MGIERGLRTLFAAGIVACAASGCATNSGQTLNNQGGQIGGSVEQTHGGISVESAICLVLDTDTIGRLFDSASAPFVVTAAQASSALSALQNGESTGNDRLRSALEKCSMGEKTCHVLAR